MGLGMCGSMHVWVHACVGPCMCGPPCLFEFMHVWVHACVGPCMCGSIVSNLGCSFLFCFISWSCVTSSPP